MKRVPSHTLLDSGALTIAVLFALMQAIYSSPTKRIELQVVIGIFKCNTSKDFFEEKTER